MILTPEEIQQVKHLISWLVPSYAIVLSKLLELYLDTQQNYDTIDTLEKGAPDA